MSIDKRSMAMNKRKNPRALRTAAKKPRAKMAAAPPTQRRRDKALDAAHLETRQKAWGQAGTPSGEIAKGVHVWTARLPTHFCLLTQGLAPRGLELSLRVTASPHDTEIPSWALALLAKEARRVRNSSESVGELLNCVVEENEGVLPPGSEFTAISFAVDSALPALATVWATVPVLQLVALTSDEARLVRTWSPSGMLQVQSQLDPFLVVDLARPSLLQSPRARQAIEQRVAMEGSSLAKAFSSSSTVTKRRTGLLWRLATEDVSTVDALLQGRLGHQRAFTIESSAATVQVRPGDPPAARGDNGQLELTLSQVAGRHLRATLKSRPGRYAFDFLPNLTVEVHP